MKTYLCLLFYLASLLIVTGAKASDFFETIEIDSDVEKTEETIAKSKLFDYRGSLQQIVKYGTAKPLASDGFDRNQRATSQVKNQLFLEASGSITKRSDALSLSWLFSTQFEAEYLKWENNQSEYKIHNAQTLIKDAYFDAVYDEIWLRLGHQTIAWGEAEGLTITDIISPNDLREPGQAQLKDIREPVPALFMSIPLGQTIKLNPVVTYKARSNRYGENDDPFDFFAPYRHQNLNVYEADLESDWEYALRLEKQFNGGDFYLVMGEVNSNAFSLENFNQNSASLRLIQERNEIFGLNINKGLGDFLLKTEVALWRDVAIPSKDLSPWQMHDQLRAMGSIEYSGWTDWVIALELDFQQTQHAPLNAAIKNEEQGGVVRAQYSAMNERLVNQWWYIKLPGQGASITRWDASYEYSDHWDLSLAWVLYSSNDPNSQFYPFRNHDSLNGTVTYSF